MKRQGLYDWKYAVLHQDRNAGAKSSKTLWGQVGYYNTLPNAIVTIKQGDDVILYQGTIRASKLVLVAPAQTELPTKVTIHTHVMSVML